MRAVTRPRAVALPKELHVCLDAVRKALREGLIIRQSSRQRSAGQEHNA
jgi:hypothetical protein